MEESTTDFDLEEAKIKDEILSYCQSKSSNIINSNLLCAKILKGRMEEDRINYFLKLIEKDGYLKKFADYSAEYRYDFSADKFLRDGGYTQVLLNERKLELGENIGSVLEAVISEAIDYNIKKDFFGISEDLNRIVKEFENNEDADWCNIGNSCRNVLKEFVKELINKSEIILDNSIKKGDVKGYIKKLVSEKTISKELKPKLVSLLNSVWNYTQKIIHRKTTTKKEALRAFIWTTLFINEIVTLLGSVSPAIASSNDRD